MRELGTDLLRAVDECDARAFDAEVAAGADGILYHLDALLESGAGDDRRVREEQQLVIRGNLHHGQVRQNFPLGQETVFLVQDGMQEVVGVDDAFHQDVGFSVAHDLYGTSCGRVGIILRDDMHEVRILFQGRVSFQDGRIANHQKFGDTLFQRAGYGILRIGVVGTDHGNAFPSVQCLQMLGQLVETTYRFHGVGFLANIRQNVDTFRLSSEEFLA